MKYYKLQFYENKFSTNISNCRKSKWLANTSVLIREKEQHQNTSIRGITTWCKLGLNHPGRLQTFHKHESVGKQSKVRLQQLPETYDCGEIQSTELLY